MSYCLHLYIKRTSYTYNYSVATGLYVQSCSVVYSTQSVTAADLWTILTMYSLSFLRSESVLKRGPLAVQITLGLNRGWANIQVRALHLTVQKVQDI